MSGPFAFTPPMGWVPRPQRVAALRQAAERAGVALLVAGPGWGKRCLLGELAQALQADGQPLLWLEGTQLAAAPLGEGPWAAWAALGPEAWVLVDGAEALGEAALAALGQRVAAGGPRSVVAGRPPLTWPGLATRRLGGQAPTWGPAELALSEPEWADALAKLGAGPLAPEGLEALGGWPMALPLAAQVAALGWEAVRADLDAHVAEAWLGPLGGEAKAWLYAASPLEALDAPCLEALGAPDGEALLGAWVASGLVVPAGLPGRWRLLGPVRRVLWGGLVAAGQGPTAARRAAMAAVAAQRPLAAAAALLAAGDAPAAATALAEAGAALVDAGEGAALAALAGRLPPEVLALAPAVAVLAGDGARLAGRFAEALGWYRKAELAYGQDKVGALRARTGVALVHLDAMAPEAGPALEAALALAEAPARRAELLALLAEQRLNAGDAEGARAARAEARLAAKAAGQAVGAEDGAEALEDPRALLRTGRLAGARRALKAALAAHGGEPPGPSQAHREPALVLALVEALLGHPAEAAELAGRGLARARRQKAPWAEAVALMRAGHAALVAGDLAGAVALHREARHLAESLGAPRLAAEPGWGLALVAARQGDLGACEAALAGALGTAEVHGDAWMGGLLRLARGEALVRAAWAPVGLLGAPSPPQGPLAASALTALAEAEAAMRACGDPASAAAAALWAFLARPQDAGGALAAVQALATAPQLLGGPTLLGFASAAEAEACARALAQASGEAKAVAALVGPARAVAWGLAEGGGAKATAPLGAHSEGAALVRLLCLGGFQAWVQGEALTPKAWGRAKARSLALALAAAAPRPVPKAELCDMLWPDLEPKQADLHFRVALNALLKALDPGREAGSCSEVVLRDGARYLLGPVVWCDHLAFEAELEAALVAASRAPLGDEAADEALRQALMRHKGPFLDGEAATEGWLEQVRDRLTERHRRGALALAQRRLGAQDPHEAARWARQVLEAEGCSEEAARALMRALHAMGDRGLALKVYDHLVVRLDDELDVDPMPETQALAKAIEAGRLSPA